MAIYLIDENLPAFLPFWNNKRFIHVSELPDINSDTGIWKYAKINKLIIVTKDSDFYDRYLSAKETPKVIWIRTGNMNNNLFNLFIKMIWEEAEEMLIYSSFIIIDEEKIEGF